MDFLSGLFKAKDLDVFNIKSTYQLYSYYYEGLCNAHKTDMAHCSYHQVLKYLEKLAEYPEIKIKKAKINLGMPVEQLFSETVAKRDEYLNDAIVREYEEAFKKASTLKTLKGQCESMHFFFAEMVGRKELSKGNLEFLSGLEALFFEGKEYSGPTTKQADPVPCFFDLADCEKLPANEWCRFDKYIPLAAERERAINLVLALNTILEQCQQLVQEFHKKKIKWDQVSFKEMADDFDYTWFEYQPLTPTGKKAKYPTVLHFSVHTTGAPSKTFDSALSTDEWYALLDKHPNYQSRPHDCKFGTIHLTGDGRPGKIRILSRERGNGITIDCAIKDGALRVVRIETPDLNWEKTGNSRIRLYDYSTKASNNDYGGLS